MTRFSFVLVSALLVGAPLAHASLASTPAGAPGQASAPASDVGIGLKEDANADRMGLLPTAATPQAGKFYINDYELLMLQFGVGITDRLEVSFLTNIPIIGMPFEGTLSAKYRYLDMTHVKLAGLITGSYIHPSGENVGYLNLGHAATFCIDQRCAFAVNATVMFGTILGAGATGDAFSILGGAGASAQLGNHVKLIAEVGSAGALAGSFFASIPGGVFTYGVRFFGGGNLAGDIMFILPFSTKSSDVTRSITSVLPLGIPLVNFTYRFGPGW